MKEKRKKLEKILTHDMGGCCDDGCAKWEFIGKWGNDRYILHKEIECNCGVDEQIEEILNLV